MGQGREGNGGRGANVLLTGGTNISYDGGALRDLRSAGHVCVYVAAPCSEAASVCDGVAAECARLRLTASRNASTKRFMFLIMPKRRDCAKSASESSIDVNRR